MIESQITTTVIEYRLQANQSSFSQSLFRLYCLALQLEKVMNEMQERAKVMRANNKPSPQNK